MPGALGVTRNHSRLSPQILALIAIGAIMLCWGSLNSGNAIDGIQAYLHPDAYQSQLTGHAVAGPPSSASALDRIKRCQFLLSLIFGSGFVLAGLVHAFRQRLPFSLAAVFTVLPGVALIVLIAFVVRWVLDPLVMCLGKDAQALGWLEWNFATALNFNYILLGMLAGVLVRNVLRVPGWAEPGTREPPKVFLKAGVIMLGGLYTAAELAHLSFTGFLMIGGFIFFSVLLVVALGTRFKTTDSMTGVLAAGLSVCGVSAVVATSSVVYARASEIAYTIATILLWGVIGVFLFPLIGHTLGLNSSQLGAWVGTAILDSSQVVGAAIAFDAIDVEALKVAGVFNVTRVMFLPVVILWLAVWYARRSASVERVGARAILLNKFPYFVVGFLAMFALCSAGVFGRTEVIGGTFRDGIAWLFTVGLIGLGMQISIDGIRRAGKRPLLIGTIVAGVKAVVSLFAVLIFL